MESIVELIGNTPLMRIKSLSKATGCEILFLNPGGSPKNRIALNIINEAEESIRCSTISSLFIKKMWNNISTFII
ncbi:4834_t:CDS:2 [Diversispora eburnea]|uniref:4834_t:CDS:1 n=1 Tax=Diversispora eburnea TaxID=1213867 RepID=A0A9N9CAR1_9GLOM|nr:4834_t:CDS:2 [Diversispora eburnea]